MRYMNSDKHFKVVSISAFCTVHDFADSRKLGEAILKAIDNMTAPWRCWPAVRCRTALSTTSAPKRDEQLHPRI